MLLLSLILCTFDLFLLACAFCLNIHEIGFFFLCCYSSPNKKMFNQDLLGAF